MVIRQAMVKDSSGIAKVHIDCWRTTYAGIISDDYLGKLSYKNRAKNWAKILTKKSKNTFVAENDGLVIGFAFGGVNRDKNEFGGELYAIYVLQDYQQKGTGEKLFDKVAESLLVNNISSMIVWVLKDNPAVNFYKRLGGLFLDEKEIKIGDQTLIEQCYGWSDLKNKPTPRY